MKQYARGCCDMYAYERLPGSLRQKILIEISAVFALRHNQSVIGLDPARKISVFMVDRHGDPAELGSLAPADIAREIIDFFPDCVECEVKTLGCHSNSWLSVSSIVKKRAKRRWPHAW